MLATAAGAVALFATLTAHLFVWPSRGMPAHVDAIVMLNGPGNRLHTALELARARKASFVVVARGSSYWGQGGRCAPAIPGVTAICFDPRPSTTQGEAEVVGRLARLYRWHSIVLVTTTAQVTRARIRVGRCFVGRLYAVTTPLPAARAIYAVAYEWAATVKAELLQRSC